MLKNEVTDLFNIEYPIIQAPMAGGITTALLVAEVSNAGGLGMIGAGYMTPSQIKEQVREIKNITSKNFGINLFVPNEYDVLENEVNSANKVLEPIFEQLHISAEKSSNIISYLKAIETFKEQVRIVIEEKVPICSFTFGIPPKQIIAELKHHHILLIGTATTVKEAIEIENAGMDVVVVQGSEAGGHRGNFINEVQESLIGLMSLIPQVTDRVNIPVVGAGGIMDGRGIMASICLGAKAVQVGTAFLTCIESGASKVYKEAILTTEEDQTVLTRAFSGKYARGIKNVFIEKMQENEEVFPNFPVQNALTQSIRKVSSSQDNKDFMALWSGQSPRLAKSQSVEKLIKNMIAEARKIIGNIHPS